jgi:serine/threonine protein kinase
MSSQSNVTNLGLGRRFQVLGEIGRGRMGIVYRVKDHGLGREVACKVPLPSLATDRAMMGRFVNEIQITAQLQHPGIPPLHDFGELPDGLPYLMMKFIRGNTLDALLQEEWNPPDESFRLVAVFEQVCQSLAYAHFRGVVHRDLEPANIMIGPFGEVQVIDWGLARVIAATPSPAIDLEDAQRPAAFGNPAYIAPELARGEAADFRADVFGLGAILCHILTGSAPFTDVSRDTLMRKAAVGNVTSAVARLDKCGANATLVTLAKHCLQPIPEDRPMDAGHLANSLAKDRDLRSTS